MRLPNAKLPAAGVITRRALPFATPAAASLLMSVLTAQAADVGQIPPNVSPNVRQWFRDAKSPRSGAIHCCDIADGHIVPYRADENGTIWVTITLDGNSAEYEVPGDAIVPPPYALLEGVVWYRLDNGKPWIRCFAPGGGL